MKPDNEQYTPETVWNAAGVCIIAALITVAALAAYGIMRLTGFL